MLVKSTFRSTKLIDGFSTCFRQWRAEGTHCKFLHGYSIYFKVTFEGPLDLRNWVVDFGFMKRSKNGMWVPKPNFEQSLYPDAWFKYHFDHTVVLAEDDPELESFKELADKKAIQLRVLPKVGCEIFAQFVFENLNTFIQKETNNKVRVVQVECFEHEKNSAIYISEPV